MSPLYNFNMFSTSDKCHAFIYAMWKIVNKISLTLKIYSRYYFKLMPLFAAVTGSFSFSRRKVALERAKACEAASFKIWLPQVIGY